MSHHVVRGDADEVVHHLACLLESTHGEQSSKALADSLRSLGIDLDGLLRCHERLRKAPEQAQRVRLVRQGHGVLGFDREDAVEVGDRSVVPRGINEDERPRLEMEGALRFERDRFVEVPKRLVVPA